MLFRRGVAPVDVKLGDRDVLQIYLGDILIWDGTTPVIVDAPATYGTGTAPTPALSVGIGLDAPAATGTGSAPVPVLSTGVTVAAAAALGEGVAPSPALSAGVTLDAPPAYGTGVVPEPAVGETVVDAPPAYGTGVVPTPGVSAGVTVIADPAIGEGAAQQPDVGAGVTISPSAATGTGSAPAPEFVSFAPSGMYKNGTQGITTSYAQIINWTADTGGYPGSSISSHGLVAQGAKTGATIAANIPFSGGLSAGVTVRIKKNGTVIATGSQVSGTTGTALCTATGQTVANGDNFTVEVIGTNNFPSVSSGTGTYLRIT